MNPTWVMVAIAAAGIVFQGGIAWAAVARLERIEKRVDDHTDHLSELKETVGQHEWRITNHDKRLHMHDQEFDRLRDVHTGGK